MKSIVEFWVFFLLCTVMFACGRSESYRLVSEKYNFSVEFPEKPQEVNKVNDEGLPKSRWELNHEKIVAKDYYTAEATSYKEILNPDDELVPNPGLLALNGVKMLENHRFKLRAPGQAGSRRDGNHLNGNRDGINHLVHLCRRRTQHGFGHCQD